MRKLLPLLLLFVTMIAWAGNVSQEEALQKAKAFINSRHTTKTQQKMRLAAKSTQINSKITTAVEQEHFYVFNAGQNDGYVVISADDRTPAILGYADEGTFDINSIPENMKAWLQSYADQIKHLQSNAALNRTAITDHKAVKPLLKSTWNQGAPYNNMCPMDGSYRSVTGCTATAMAQVINYHKYPAQTTATIPAYVTNSKKFSIESIAPTVIDWENMKDNYTGNETQTEKDAVATLMKICGTSLEMDYSYAGSSASTNYIPDLLKIYFNYDAGATHISRDDYRASEWDDIIYNELANKRPVLYSGLSTGGGHAFVIDGYDKEGMYHVNWGWGGSSDGYFLLSILDPDSNSGIGASSSTDGYSFGQDASIGVQPNTGVKPVRDAIMTTYSIKTDQTVVTKKNNTFPVKYITETRNYTGESFTFDLGIGVYDKDNNLKYASFQWSTTELPNGWGYSATELSCNIPSLPDGTYIITNISRKKGTQTWYQNKNSYRYYITATVSGNTMTLQNPTIDISGTVEVSGNTEVNCKQTATATITNNGSFFNEVIYMLVDNEETGGRYFEAATGESVDLAMTFTPSKAGTKTITFATKKYLYNNATQQLDVHYTDIATTTMEIKPAMANNLTLSNGKVLNATNKTIYDNVALIQFTVTNNNSSEYYNDIRLWSLWNDGASLSRTYYYNTMIDKEIRLAPGESKTMEVEMPLNKDGNYWFNISYKTNGKFICNEDIKDSRNINLSTYKVVVPEPTPEEVSVAPIIAVKEENPVVYDIQGRRINNGQMKKGLYIINGKKVVK